MSIGDAAYHASAASPTVSVWLEPVPSRTDAPAGPGAVASQHSGAVAAASSTAARLNHTCPSLTCRAPSCDTSIQVDFAKHDHESCPAGRASSARTNPLPSGRRAT